MNDNDIHVETLQIDLDGLGKWSVENAMKINAGNCKALIFTRARVNDPINYFLGRGYQNISEESNCKYLRIMLRSDLS
jgi:hypothetical protein